MRFLFLPAILLLIFQQASAQKNAPATDKVLVEGEIKKELTINIDSLKQYPTETIDSLVITNHLGQRKSGLKNIKAVPVRDILSKVEILSESPKQLSEYYFVFIAADGYKVVFSWNEIFNNEIGEKIYFIVGKDGKKIEELDDRISVFSQTDLMTGRRYVKGLQKIIIKRAD